MSLDDFSTSETEEDTSDEQVVSGFKNCRTKAISDTERLDTPEFVSVWVSDDGLAAMMEVPPDYFREHVSEEIKDQAKEKGLILLDTEMTEPVVVLTDDPEKYGTPLKTFGLETYLHKRVKGVI